MSGRRLEVDGTGCDQPASGVPTGGRVGVLGGQTKGNLLLVEGWVRLGYDAELMSPTSAAETLVSGDVALVRLDVLPTLDGIEPGLDAVEQLVRRGLRVLNRPPSLLAVHDKLVTHTLLCAAGLPQPVTVHVIGSEGVDCAPVPCVVKPRYGSWGRDVCRCTSKGELRHALRSFAERSWFRRHGALVQELLPTGGTDLRILVAGGRVVGAARRIAAPGEWRTNVALGGTLEPLHGVPDDAAEASRAAAAAVGIDLACVDLVPGGGGGPLVLELNGAADFDSRYSLGGEDAYREAALALDLPRPRGGGAQRPVTIRVGGASPAPGASESRR